MLSSFGGRPQNLNMISLFLNAKNVSYLLPFVTSSVFLLVAAILGIFIVP